MSGVESNQTNQLDTPTDVSGTGHLIEHFKGNQLQYLISILIAAQLGWLDSLHTSIIGVCM